MATYRLFCYNPSANGNISGTEQVGDIAAATGSVSVNSAQEWWNGPDEDLGYVVCYVDASGNRPNSTERLFGGNIPCHLGFKRSVAKTDESFLSLSKRVTGSQSLSSASAAKTLLNSNGYWTSYELPSKLLDVYTNAAVAYSLRRLTTSYVGSAIRVRRSSDNTEMNIGFDANGDLDTTTLTTFVGAGNGFVTTWYDQSGMGRNATQTSATIQPQIVTSGVVETKNGKPNIKFIYDQMTIGTQVVLAVPNYITFVGGNTSNTESIYAGFVNYYSGGVSAENPEIRLGRSDGDSAAIYWGGGGSVISSGFLTNRIHTLQTVSGITMTYYGNATQVETITRSGTWSSTVNANGFTLGGSFWGNRICDFQEFIVYNSDQSINRTGITTNINSYYSIYV